MPLAMTVQDYFAIVKPQYSFLKVKPLKSLRNYNSDKLITMVAALYRSIWKRIQKENKKYFFTVEVKLAYYIYMEHDKVEFYFVLPSDYKGIILSKIRDTWMGVTLEEVNEIPNFSAESVKYCMDYAKQDIYSLACDKRNNDLLSALCQNIYMMDAGDRVGVFYNFTPYNATAWRNQYDKLANYIRNGNPSYKNGEKADMMLALSVVVKILDYMLSFVTEFFGDKPTESKQLVPIEASPDTSRKREKPVVKTQVIVFADSPDRKKANNLATSVCESFKALTHDNELNYMRMPKKEVDLLAPRIKGASMFYASSNECQNFLSLPGREIIEEFKIDSVATLETEVPKDLQTGYISLGKNICKGVETEAFLRDNYDQGNLPLVMIGEQGSGKTTYLSNYAKAIRKRGEGCVVIDYIMDCDLANAIATPDSIVLDFSNINNVQGIGYNELKPRTDSPLDIVDVANRKSLYTSMLIDAINADGEPLTSSMDRYLNAASNIVFLNPEASMRDVIRCLNDHVYRKKCIENMPRGTRELLEDEIVALLELDEKKGDETVGTKSNKIDGVNHRINQLKKDFRLKMMFQKSCADNVDFVDIMEQGKQLIIKMPQAYFGSPAVKNVIVTYLFTKLWAAMLVRGSMHAKPKRFHIIVDELFQAPTAMQLLRDQEILPQTRKFGCKFVLSCQYLDQMKVIDQTLRSAGASYMMLKGSGKSTFNAFKDELSPYTLEDLEALPIWWSLNLVNYEGGRAKFITRLPPKP